MKLKNEPSLVILAVMIGNFTSDDLREKYTVPEGGWLMREI
jgi:hypothetical protein